jgi:hypothetical protein
LVGFSADLTAAAHEAGLQIEEEQVEGDPVLLLTIPGADFHGKSRSVDQLSLDSLEINAGEIYVAGHTGHVQTAAAPSQQSDLDRQ